MAISSSILRQSPQSFTGVFFGVLKNGVVELAENMMVSTSSSFSSQSSVSSSSSSSQSSSSISSQSSSSSTFMKTSSSSTSNSSLSSSSSQSSSSISSSSVSSPSSSSSSSSSIEDHLVGSGAYSMTWNTGAYSTGSATVYTAAVTVKVRALPDDVYYGHNPLSAPNFKINGISAGGYTADGFITRQDNSQVMILPAGAIVFSFTETGGGPSLGYFTSGVVYFYSL